MASFTVSPEFNFPPLYSTFIFYVLDTSVSFQERPCTSTGRCFFNPCPSVHSSVRFRGHTVGSHADSSHHSAVTLCVLVVQISSEMSNRLYIGYYFQLYKMLLRSYETLPSSTARSFLVERTRLEFRAHRQETRPERIENLLERAHSVLLATVDPSELKD